MGRHSHCADDVWDALVYFSKVGVMATCAQIAQHAKATEPAVRHQLKLLMKKGVVTHNGVDKGRGFGLSKPKLEADERARIAARAYSKQVLDRFEIPYEVAPNGQIRCKATDWVVLLKKLGCDKYVTK